MSARDEEISTGTAAAYAVGSLGTGVFSTVPAVLLLYFCTETLGISPAWAGLVMFIPKAWSILWDPFVGTWSDRHTGRFGRRRPFLLLGNFGIVVGFIVLFSPPEMGSGATIAWVAISYFLLATAYSLFAVPYISLPAEIAQSSAGRRKLVSWRITVGMAGVLAGASLSAYLVAWFGGGRVGYAAMAVIIAAACAVAMMGPFLVMRGRELVVTRSAKLKMQWRLAARSSTFRALCGAYLLQLTSVGMLTSAIPFFVTQLYGRSEADIGTAMASMLGLSILCVWLWSRAAQIFGEFNSLLAAVMFFCASSAAVAVAAWTQIPWMAALLLFGLAGAAFAGIQVLPFTLLAHAAHRHSQEAGHSVEATFTGVWTAAEKLGLAIGPSLTAFSLSLAGSAMLPIAAAVIMSALSLASIPLLKKASL